MLLAIWPDRHTFVSIKCPTILDAWWGSILEAKSALVFIFQFIFLNKWSTGLYISMLYYQKEACTCKNKTSQTEKILGRGKHKLKTDKIAKLIEILHIHKTVLNNLFKMGDSNSSCIAARYWHLCFQKHLSSIVVG